MFLNLAEMIHDPASAWKAFKSASTDWPELYGWQNISIPCCTWVQLGHAKGQEKNLKRKLSSFLPQTFIVKRLKQNEE